MSAAETWFTVAAVVAAVAALLHLVGMATGPRTVGPGLVDPVARALTAVAVALLAIGFVVATP